ncbi:MAG TPA: protealysin inhibitor emfourin [Acidimicrobiia bacterium]
MRVEVVRRGGIAGVPVRGELETAALPAGVRTAAEKALAALPFGAPAPTPAHPDGFSYEITLAGEARGPAVLDEHDVSPPVRAAIEQALVKGRPG